MKHILVPLDGSDVAEGVLPYVEDLAKSLAARVHLIQVIDLRPTMATGAVGTGILLSPDLYTEQLESETQEAEQYLTAMVSSMKSKGIDAIYEVVREPMRTPAKVIIEYAKDHGIELIAMSTHGRSGLSRLVFGSVAEEVMRAGVIPVLLIRPRHLKEATKD